ncbi:MAG: hypothetical protein AAGK37_19310 [Pseudomonadota bacterium]
MTVFEFLVVSLGCFYLGEYTKLNGFWVAGALFAAGGVYTSIWGGWNVI